MFGNGAIQLNQRLDDLCIEKRFKFLEFTAKVISSLELISVSINILTFQVLWSSKSTAWMIWYNITCVSGAFRASNNSKRDGKFTKTQSWLKLNANICNLTSVKIKAWSPVNGRTIVLFTRRVFWGLRIKVNLPTRGTPEEHSHHVGALDKRSV